LFLVVMDFLEEKELQLVRETRALVKVGVGQNAS
jgi:hypothetical protein